MKNILIASLFVAMTTASAWASKPSKVISVDSTALAWKEVVPGVMIAPVDGNPDKGASHFFLKYAAGLKTPLHHHSADHYVTLVSGSLTMTVDGKDIKLSPGSYFALTQKAPHVAQCAEGADCVMSIDARKKWDVVPEGERK